LARAKTAGAGDGTGRSLAETSAGKSVVRGGPIPVIVAAWATRNGCSAMPTETQIASDVHLVHSTCPKHADVDFYRIESGGHTWPGSALSKSFAGSLGATTMSIDADAITWAFFQAQPLRGT